MAYGLHLADYEASLEQCGECHRPRSECSDPERDWFPQRTICYATRAQAVAQRMYDELHDAMPFHDGSETLWSKEYAANRQVRYDDGVTVWVSSQDLTPDDEFLSSPTAQSLPDDDEAVV